MVNQGAKDLGNLLGNAVKGANSYKEDFIPTADTSDINISNIEDIELEEGFKITQNFVIGCDISGANGGFDPFVINHPVNGNIDSPDFYIDGDYCSSSTFYDDTLDLTLSYVVDESSNYVVDESGNFVIGIF